MKTITIKMHDSLETVIPVGIQGEKDIKQIVFDCSKWADEYGTGSAIVYLKRNGDSSAYPVNLVNANKKATWTVKAADTEKSGVGSVEIRWYSNNAVKVSKTMDAVILPNIGAIVNNTPATTNPWLDNVGSLLSQAETKLESAIEYADDAEASATAASGVLSSCQALKSLVQIMANDATSKANLANTYATSAAASAAAIDESLEDIIATLNSLSASAVKSVNGRYPDSNGNVTIPISGGSGGTYDDTEIRQLIATKAAANHNHDNAYSALGHNHDGVYSSVNHTHESYENGVKSVNNTLPDTSGNVTIETGGGNSEILKNITLTEDCQTLTLSIDKAKYKEIYIYGETIPKEGATAGNSAYIIYNGTSKYGSHGVCSDILAKGTTHAYFMFRSLFMKEGSFTDSSCIQSSYANGTAKRGSGIVMKEFAYTPLVSCDTEIEYVHIRCGTADIPFGIGTKIIVEGVKA